MGNPLDELLLPSKRWTTRRKAMVVEAVRGGQLTLQEACKRYQLSVDEFLSWECAIERHGVPGLRTTRVQIYREKPRRSYFSALLAALSDRLQFPCFGFARREAFLVLDCLKEPRL